MTAELKQFPVMQLIDEQHLERFTLDGWRVIEVIRATRVDHGIRQEPDPDAKQRDPYYRSPDDGKMSLKVPFVVDSVRFLVGLDENSAVAQLTAALKEANAQRDNFEYRLDGALKAHDATTRKLDETEKARATEAQTNERLHKTSVSLGAQVRKLEEDIAKIRNAIGERQMKEILAGK